MSNRRLNRGQLILIAVTLTILWFALLAWRPLYDPDEGRYAEIPREMAAGGDWLIPHLDGLIYLEKPPLQYWLTAATFRAFGQSEFTARLWTGIAGYASLIMVFFVGSRLWGVRAGQTALLLTGASTLFDLLAHQLTLDMVLSACLLASLACFLMAESDASSGGAASGRARKWMLGCWAAMALAMLTKGLIGVLVPAATLAIYLLWNRDFGVLRRLNIRWGLPLFTLIAAPWFVMAARANSAFLHFFFIREHFQRFLTPIEHRSEPWWYFAPVLAVGILPWLAQAVRALIQPLRSPAPRRSFDPARVLWAWSVFVLVFFSTSDAKLIPYILPALPALALLASVPTPPQQTRRELVIGGLLSLAACAGVLGYASGTWITESARPLMEQLRPVLMGTVTVLTLAGSGCLALTKRRRLDAALAVLCGGWFLASASVLIAANGAQRFFSAKDAALALNSLDPATADVFSVQTYEQSFAFYARRTVILVDYRDEFTLGLTQEPQRGIASLDDFSARWTSLSDGYAIMPPLTRDTLRDRGLPMHEIARFPNSVLMRRR
jgi:4-amino-4-deoxy-L-arabinose transferase-like glycosyltransferase